MPSLILKLFLSGGDFETGHPSRDETRGGTVSPRFPPRPDKRDSRKDVTRDHRSMDRLNASQTSARKSPTFALLAGTN